MTIFGGEGGSERHAAAAVGRRDTSSLLTNLCCSQRSAHSARGVMIACRWTLPTRNRGDSFFGCSRGAKLLLRGARGRGEPTGRCMSAISARVAAARTSRLLRVRGRTVNARWEGGRRS